MKNIIIDKNHDNSIGLGVEVYTHKHMSGCPYHLHITFIFLAWFIELQIGRDIPNENKSK